MTDGPTEGLAAREPVAMRAVAGKRLRGGRRARGLFSKLLGLARPAPPLGIAGVTWVEDHFELSARTPEGAALTLVLEKLPARPEPRPFAATAHLSLWYRDGELPRAAGDLAKETLAGFRTLTLEHVVERFLKDPELEEPSPLSDSVPEEAKRSRPEVGIWDPEGVYADFLAIDEFSLFPTESIEIASDNPFMTIQHADLECSTFSPSAEPSNMHLVTFPWVAEVDRRKNAGPVPARTEEDEIALFTDLGENDVIMGGIHKLREVLEYALEHHDDKTIIFTNTCVPAMTGEDVASFVERYQEKRRLPILFHNRALPKSAIDLFDEVLGHVDPDAEAEAHDDGGGQRSVNLVGFAEEPAREELRDLLGELGISVNTCVLPTLTREALAKMPGAPVNVFLRSHKEWDHLYKSLTRHRAPARNLFPPAPYGLGHTRGWLEAVAQAVGAEAGVDALWSKRLEPLEPQWSRMRERAAQHRIGLVLRPIDLHYLSDPAYTWGVDLLGVFEDLGFELELLVQSSAQEAPDLHERLRRLLSRPADHRYQSFDGLEEMRAALAESDCSAVLSNHVFDWRLSEAGKGRVSLQHFDKGIRGAFETLERLLAICETPFYRRYASYLQRSPIGLRPREERGDGG